jgi:hypothetical protein
MDKNQFTLSKITISILAIFFVILIYIFVKSSINSFHSFGQSQTSVQSSSFQDKSKSSNDSLKKLQVFEFQIDHEKAKVEAIRHLKTFLDKAFTPQAQKDIKEFELENPLICSLIAPDCDGNTARFVVVVFRDLNGSGNGYVRLILKGQDEFELFGVGDTSSSFSEIVEETRHLECFD